MRVLSTVGDPLAYPFVSLESDGETKVSLKIWRSVREAETYEFSRPELLLIVRVILDALDFPTDYGAKQ